MGIARGMARLLLSEAQKSPFNGSILELGRQLVYFNMDELIRWAAWHGVKLAGLAFVDKSHHPELAERGCMDDQTFFSALGFKTVHSLDVSDYEQSTHTLDLNLPVPEGLYGFYDVILDGGTLEHVFDQAAALRNIHRLLKVGGRVIHGAPSTNHVDHGFYMYSPTFFYEFYAANGYKIETSYIFQYTERHDTDPWKIYAYQPGALKKMRLKPFPGPLGIYFVARKANDAPDITIPYQGRYKRAWDRSDSGKPAKKKRPKSCLKHEPVFGYGWLLQTLRQVGRKTDEGMPPFLTNY
ncbi:MAG: methyltransferase domain-containing protein [Candidatus Omnitrophica bacterium]|nr:methyltransferase domain-containing protein [Candidatus Omnitrophota bacterium]